MDYFRIHSPPPKAGVREMKMSAQLKRMASEAAHLANHNHTHGAEIVTPQVMNQCVAECMFAPEGKLATIAWFNGFFDEMNLKPHRYDFRTPKGLSLIHI